MIESSIILIQRNILFSSVRSNVRTMKTQMAFKDSKRIEELCISFVDYDEVFVCCSVSFHKNTQTGIGYK